MKKTRCLILIISLLIIVACNKSNKRALSILEEATQLVDSVPKVALTKLQEIKKPTQLPAGDFAKYNLLFAKSIIRTGGKMSPDSALIQPTAYFKENKDSLHLSETYFYRGLYHYNQQQYEAAISYFENAAQVLPIGHNAQRAKAKRIAGYAHLYLGNTTKAIECQKEALAFAQQSSQKTDEEQFAMVSLAEAYKYHKEIEKSIETYIDVINFARQNNNPSLEIDILNKISSLYESENDIEQALKYKKRAKEMNKKRTNIPITNLNLARLYFKQNMLDSATHHAQIAIGGNDSYAALLAYSLMSEISHKKGQHTAELNYLKNENNLFNTINMSISSKNMEHKYLEEKLKNKSNQLKIEQQRHKMWFLIGSFLLFVLIAIFFFIWRETKRRNEKAQLRNKEILLKKENELLKQKQEISSLREKELMLRESLFKRINMFNKVPSLKNERSDNPKHNKIQLTETDWEELIRGIDDAYPHFISQLREKAPTLTEDELRFCCLIKINVDMQDLSDIYCVSKAAITKRKYRLKTEKFNVTDSNINLNTLILEI